jgi:hypothetical protein
MVEFCKYRHIFGIEKEGVHQYRLLNVAIVDTVLTMLFAFALALYFKVSFLFVFFILLVIATLLHRLFCVETTLTKIVFPNFTQKNESFK